MNIFFFFCSQPNFGRKIGLILGETIFYSHLCLILHTLLCTHDIALGGKDSKSGNLNDFLDFRIEAGDAILKEHMEKASGNAKYTSFKIQNELIGLCEQTVRDEIAPLAHNSIGFSILADEISGNISGTEQFAIGVRFFDEKKNC